MRRPRRTGEAVDGEAPSTGARSVLALVGAAALGLVAGLAATTGRKVARGAADSLTGDWLDVLKAEHLTVLELFDRVERTQDGQPRRRKALLARIRHGLERYAFEEETVVYPVLRQTQPDLVGELIADHAEIKALVYELEGLDPDDAAWMPLSRGLADTIERHARREEEAVFPAFRQALAPAQERRLTRALLKAGQRMH